MGCETEAGLSTTTHHNDLEVFNMYYMNKQEMKDLINAMIMFGEQNNWIYR